MIGTILFSVDFSRDICNKFRIFMRTGNKVNGTIAMNSGFKS